VDIKECECCAKKYEPDPRLDPKKARVCGKAVCLKWRAAQAKGQWRANNAPYYKGSEDRHRTGYWKAYRAAHPDKTERHRAQNRERMRQRRALCATQDAIQKNPLGYLEELGVGALCATQDAIVRRVDGILVYLRACATQDSMDGRIQTAG
jgi:hypothetical protein